MLTRSPICLACLLILTVTLALAACGGEEADKDAGGADVVADVAPEDAAADVVAGCGAAISCLNDNGIENKGLCPVPQSEWDCVQGCCVAKVICKTDADCDDRVGTADCPDDRFDCGCDVDSGACIQEMCRDDSACATGEICVSGGCGPAPAVGGLAARLLRPYWIARPGEAIDAASGLGAQAVDAKGAVAPVASFEWQMSGSKSFSMKDGKLTALEMGGSDGVKARVKGGIDTWSAEAALWNLGAVPADMNLRVAVADESGLGPIAAKVVVIGMADSATPAAAVEVALSDGQASFAGVVFPADIHIVGDAIDDVSVLRFQPEGAIGDVLLTTRQRHYATLEFDGDGKLIKENSSLVNGDVVTGTIDYQGEGEAALGITSLALGTALFNFNLDALVGPEVRRPFHPKAMSIINPEPGKPQDIPGGVSFSLGNPVVDTFVLASRPGHHVLWSLAGRVALDELLSQVSTIVEAASGGDGLDIGAVVGALLPHLSNFRSYVAFDVEFRDGGKEPFVQLDLLPNVPLLLDTVITPPALPSAGEGVWADLGLFVSGAMLPSGQIVPLGLTAGSDKADSEDVADGLIDGDAEEPGSQPLVLSSAPLHSGLRYGAANHVLVTAAINVAGNGKKEGGSIVVGEPGVLPAAAKPEPFLPFSLGSTWTQATRTLTIAKVEGAHFYRVIVLAAENRQWHFFVPALAAAQTIALPDGTAWGEADDVIGAPKRVFVSAFELREQRSLPGLLVPDGLPDLVRLVKRSSFIDVRD
mgnify:CR=1 FL=1